MSLIKFTSNSKVKILDKTIFSTSLNEGGGGEGGGGEGGGGPSYGPFWSGWSTEPTYTFSVNETEVWTVSGNTLDISPRTALTSFNSNYSYAGGSGVIDARGCTNLTTLNCYYSDITSLNVSGCSSLEILWCTSTPLTYLNIDGCTNLKNLSFYGTTFISEEMANYIFTTLDSFGTGDYGASLHILIIYYNINEETPSSILTAKANLESRGWNVMTF